MSKRREYHRQPFNTYKIIDDTVSEFYITNRSGENFTVLVDTEDLFRLIEFNRPWNAKLANGDHYASCCQYLSQENGKSKYKIHYLHRWIFGEPKGVLIDHINHNPLDNRKENLRYSNRSTNAFNRDGRNKNNSTGYRNVAIIGGKIVAQIVIDGKNTQFGPYDTLEEAAENARMLRDRYYGEFAGNP